jgi:hypothetical protein
MLLPVTALNRVAWNALSSMDCAKSSAPKKTAAKVAAVNK